MLTVRRVVESVVVSALALVAIAVPTVIMLQDGPVQLPIQITISDSTP